MAYFQTDDIPVSPPTKPRFNLILTSPAGKIIMKEVKSFKIRDYYKLNYGFKIGSNGKKIWREKLTELGYKIENYENPQS